MVQTFIALTSCCPSTWPPEKKGLEDDPDIVEFIPARSPGKHLGFHLLQLHGADWSEVCKPATQHGSEPTQAALEQPLRTSLGRGTALLEEFVTYVSQS